MHQRHHFLRKFLISSCLILTSAPVYAQITPDNTLGAEASRLTSNVLVRNALGDRVDGGAQRGGNLFHSFTQFNVGDGQRVYFANPVGVQNILTRVTGGQVSNILGTLGVDGSANLFLLNPNGILFGPNARLDVGGSFVGTTANSFVFPNQVEFSATNPQAPPLLTINLPIGLQFGSQPGRMISQGSQLGVTSGSTLALIGGEIALDGGVLFAPNGQVQLGAVGGDTTVGLQVNGSSLGFRVPQNTRRFPITLTNGSLINTTGNSTIQLVGGQIGLNGSSLLSVGGGSIFLDATQLNLDNRSLIRTVTQGATKGSDIQIQASDAVTLANGRIISESNNPATGDSGDVSIAARNITITGDETTSESAIITFTNGQANAGNLTLQATDSLNITNGGFVTVLTSGAGNTGNLTVRARKSVNVTEQGSLALATFGSGSTGNLQIETGTFKIQNTPSRGAAALSSGVGSAGSIFIQARDAVEIINGQINVQAVGGVGQAGNITLETQRLNLIDGGRIVTNTTGSADAGNIVVRASEAVDIRGVRFNPLLNSAISSNTGLFGATGNGGNITIETPRLTLSQAGQISTSSVQSRGNAGNIAIHSKDVELDGFVIVPDGFSRSEISTAVFVGERDVKGGTLSVDTERLRLTNGAQLTTSVSGGQGQAGNLVVRASDSINISGVGPRNRDGIPLSSGLFAEVQTGGIGSGGSINVETGRLSLSNGGQISGQTFAQGNAGNISINADFIDLRREPTGELTGIFAEVGNEATGNAGDIRVNTQRLNLQDGAYISSATSGNGNAGNLTLQANDIELIGANSGLFLSVEEGAKGNGGILNITTNRLTVRNGGVISSRTSGQGRAGDIRINANDSITLDGTQKGFSSLISARNAASSTGGGGNITLNTNTFRLNQGANILATTANASPGGNVTINANTSDLTNGGQILTSTSSSGQAGNINLNSNRINLAGIDFTYAQRLAEFGKPTVTNEGEASGLYANTTEDSFGKGGTISVNSRQLNINDRARISVDSRGRDIAGNININAQSVQLRDRASIVAETASQDGGNINIENANLLLLRRGSLISATAAEGGNGGNITIDARAIVAVPQENSDILANAFQGRGGNITINTQGVFGIVPASFSTSQSDITASSELGVQGQIDINQPEIQRTQGIIELPSSVVDASTQIAQICPRSPNAKPLGEFIITGRGSLPPNPLQPLAGTSNLSPLATLDGESYEADTGTRGWGDAGSFKASKGVTEIVEAQGWIKTADGAIALVAFAPQATPFTRPTSAVCPVSLQQ
ncbi:hypothetical protein BZZ01_15680 [Nostocales cyanobacterium HT-58-2]|nr:hypothetical protein BZZ01_15680 [Nostocales cyanobacterium HT-58-2]